MLGPGEPVLWRKLWNGAVMTALPMRVVWRLPSERGDQDARLA
jgi:hypothetical protein